MQNKATKGFKWTQWRHARGDCDASQTDKLKLLIPNAVLDIIRYKENGAMHLQELTLPTAP